MEGLIQKSQSFDHSAEIEKMANAMPPQMRQAFDQIVKAGVSLLYAKQTRPQVVQILSADAPVEERLGNGVANLVIMIDNQANGNVPKEVMIPAGTVLLFEAADLLREAGEKITVEQMGKAYEMMFYGIFAGYGMEPDQVDSAFSGMESKLKAKEDDPNGEEPQGQEDDGENEYA